MFSKQDLRQPMMKNIYVRPRDYLCNLRLRNVNCANWRNACIGDRTIVFFCRKW